MRVKKSTLLSFLLVCYNSRTPTQRGRTMPNIGKVKIGIRLLHLKHFLEANAGPKRIVTRSAIEEYLLEKGCWVKKKTIYSDFAILESEFGLQLEYDPRKKGYRLLNPPFEPYELRLMVDGVQSSKFITREKAREITDKIKKLAGQETLKSLNDVHLVNIFLEITCQHIQVVLCACQRTMTEYLLERDHRATHCGPFLSECVPKPMDTCLL